MNKPLKDSPASVSVIDRQMIRNSGARQVADIFRMVPGMVVGYHNGYSPAVTYQGLGTEWQRQLQVLIDGRSVFIPSFGGIPWSNLPLLLEDIERVEVTRGPNAVTYGANAFLATINIITRHAAEDIGTRISVTHDLDSNNEAKDIYFRVGNQYQDLDWKITAGTQKDDGYEIKNDSKSLKIINFRTDFLTDYNQFWTIQTGINQGVFDKGDGDPDDIFRENESTNIYQNIKWELVQDKVTTQIQLSHTKQDFNDSFTSERLNETIDEIINMDIFSSIPLDITMDISYDRVSSRMDFEIFQKRSLTDNTQLVYGASVRKDNVVSQFLFNDTEDHKITSNRLFSSIEWKNHDDLIFDFGFMLEDTTYIDNELSSRLSIIKKLANGHNLRLVSSQAKRNPVLYEIIGNTQFHLQLPDNPLQINDVPLITWLVDGKIKPEKIQSEEIGLFSEYLDRQLSTDIKIFSYKITNPIFDFSTTIIEPQTGLPQDVTNVKNEPPISAKGIEASFNFSPQQKEYRLYGGFTHLKADTTNKNVQDSFPELTLFAGGHIDLNPDNQFSLSLYYVDKMSWIDNSTLIDDHIKLDLRYQYTLNEKYNTQLEFIGYNLYEDYSEYLKTGSQDRSFLLRFSSRF